MVEGMKVTSWRQEDRQSKKTLDFNMWNGRVSIQAYESGNLRNKSFNHNLNDTELILVEKAIAKVIAGSPETKQSINFSKYDFNSKQFRLDGVFTIEKDSKQLYRITLTDCKTQNTVSFVLKAPATATLGPDPLSDSNLSSLKLESLKAWLINAKIWAPFTFVPQQNNGGRRGGGNGGGNGGGGYSQPSGAAAPSGDSDDLPF